MSGREITIIAVLTCGLALMWVVIVTYIMGLYVDCIPGDPEYGCLTANQQLSRSIAAIGFGGILTCLLWAGLHRAGRSRRRD